MLKNTLVALSLVAVSSSAAAVDFDANVTPFFDFVNKTLIGRTVTLQSDPCAAPIPGTDIRCEFSATLTYGNLVRTPSGFKYQTLSVTKQTNYVPQPDGSVLTQNKDRQGASECEMRILKSPEAKGKMFGFCRPIASTIFDPTGSFSPEVMTIEGDEMIIKARTGNFFDAYYNNEAGYRLASSETSAHYKLENGKLLYTFDTQKYYHDEQGNRTTAGEPEHYVYKEK